MLICAHFTFCCLTIVIMVMFTLDVKDNKLPTTYKCVAPKFKFCEYTVGTYHRFLLSNYLKTKDRCN